MTKNITFCSVCVAISVTILLFTNILPFNTAFLLCAATVPYPLSKIKCGGKYSACALVAGILLAFMFLADKFFWISFSLLGIYSLLKGEIEKITRLWAEILVKALIYFAVGFMVFAFFKGEALAIMLAAGAVLFVLYDIALTIFISYIKRKIRL